MANVKGSLLQTRFDYLNEKCTPGQKAAVLEHLSPTLQALISTGATTVAWYPVSHYYEFLEAIKTHAGNSRPEILYDLGKYTGYKSLRGIYKIFVKIGTPEFYLSRVKAIWSRLFDFGEISADIPEKGVCDLTVKGFESMPLVFAEALQGWVVGTLEVCGAKNITYVMVHPPTAKEPFVHIRGTWSI